MTTTITAKQKLLTMPEQFAALRQPAEIGEAKLWYDPSRKRYYLLVRLTMETPDPSLESHTRIVGVDVGQRYSEGSAR